MCRFVSISIAALALCLSLCECTSGGHQEQPAKAPYPSKEISSPNWPKSYPKDTMVRMEEAANYGTRLNVTFDVLDLEGFDGKVYDYILIYINADPPTEICNRSSNHTMEVFADWALRPAFVADRFALDFCSDYSVQGRGFAATVTHEPKPGANPKAKLSCGQPVHKPGLAVSPNGIDAMTGSAGGGEPADIGDRGNTVLIRGGVMAEPHSHPWQASLQIPASVERPGKYKHDCGGSLIYAQWVVTAAHCVWGKEKADMRIYLGAHSLKGVDCDPAVQRMDIEQIVVHERYDHTPTAGYDIALLKLSREAAFTDAVQPICLPSPKDSWRKDGGNVVATGWGHTKWVERPDKLHQVMMPCDASACATLPNNTMCTNMDEQLTGPGDSGGPLIDHRNGRYVLAGITSGGPTFWPEIPGRCFYMHVPSYMGWIEKHVGKL